MEQRAKSWVLSRKVTRCDLRVKRVTPDTGYRRDYRRQNSELIRFWRPFLLYKGEKMVTWTKVLAGKIVNHSQTPDTFQKKSQYNLSVSVDDLEQI